MDTPSDFDIFLVCPPGLEPLLAAEARENGFAPAEPLKGGVLIRGSWAEVWRANLQLRCATRVLARIASFRAMHLAQLDKRARRVPWAELLRKDVPVRVEVACRKSRIYHAGAAAQRIERAIAEELGAPIVSEATEGAVQVKARIEDDLCEISVDTSGESLHKRGHKPAVGKAPLRETMAALFLRQCGFAGREPVVDPMCGSGTFVIEAAEIAAGFAPGRSRSFAFEDLAGFDATGWAALRGAAQRTIPDQRFYGYDRDQGAISMSSQNAVSSGVAGVTEFACQPISDLVPPPGPAGLVMVNPPYGARIGNRNLLFGLYGTLGSVLKQRFSGWRVGLVTSDAGLARTTELPFLPNGPTIDHGGLRIRLYRTDTLP
ncbi:class I SAM-dependent RNA methyltransferase [Tropicimonas sp. IMCC34043]|uniref:THUMP domain-containing class I SAM-dependent RNA methyltransferase n=1 Tax=Tropicimonas sp. IMCC34043 TaxID=2248760 RepID=UPI000E21CF90|nr:class I SAM-dependent RNA methyltransferase [Tropicimonas sp. IMCC34043]